MDHCNAGIINHHIQYIDGKILNYSYKLMSQIHAIYLNSSIISHSMGVNELVI